MKYLRSLDLRGHVSRRPLCHPMEDSMPPQFLNDRLWPGAISDRHVTDTDSSTLLRASMTRFGASLGNFYERGRLLRRSEYGSVPGCVLRATVQTGVAKTLSCPSKRCQDLNFLSPTLLLPFVRLRYAFLSYLCNRCEEVLSAGPDAGLGACISPHMSGLSRHPQPPPMAIHQHCDAQAEPWRLV